MKKVVLLIMLILLTGCGTNKKTITCSQKQKDSNFTGISKTIVNFKNDKIDSYITSTDINVPDEYQDKIEELANEAKKSFLEYEKYSGVTVKSKTTKTSIYISLKVDTKKINKKDLDSVNQLLDLNSDYDTIKNSFEKLDYKCE